MKDTAKESDIEEAWAKFVSVGIIVPGVKYDLISKAREIREAAIKFLRLASELDRPLDFTTKHFEKIRPEMLFNVAVCYAKGMVLVGDVAETLMGEK